MGILPMWEPKTLLQDYLFVFQLPIRWLQTLALQNGNRIFSMWDRFTYIIVTYSITQKIVTHVSIFFLIPNRLLQALGAHTFDCSIGSKIFSYFLFSYYYEILSNKIVSASNLKINSIMPHYWLNFFFFVFFCFFLEPFIIRERQHNHIWQQNGH